MLAYHKLLSGSYVYQSLGSDGVEASSAGVAAGSVLILGEQGHDGEMVVGALAYALVCAERPFVELGGEGLAPLLEGALLLCGGLHYPGELVLLGLEVGLAYGDGVGYPVKIGLAVLDGLLGLAYVLLGDFLEQALVLELLVDGIVFAAVGLVMLFSWLRYFSISSSSSAICRFASSMFCL